MDKIEEISGDICGIENGRLIVEMPDGSKRDFLVKEKEIWKKITAWVCDTVCVTLRNGLVDNVTNVDENMDE